MGCYHETIKLEVLNEKDAIDLFLSYVGINTSSSSNDFKDVASGIVKECGRLPIAIITVARALNSRPLNDWKDALERMRAYEPLQDVNQDLKEAYNSLRLSYDNIKNENARQLFLLCSLFPEDSEIPIELLNRIAIGLGLCGDADRYSASRSQFTPIKNELIDSCLLLKAGNETVKMHDLVREVALWIENKKVQVGMDSITTLKENIQYSSWKTSDFPNHLGSSKLEALLVWINESNEVKVPDAFFEGSGDLKILILECLAGSKLQISTPSLLQPLEALKNVQTLAIKSFELEDISILASLKSLTSLELIECSIIELPSKIRELEKLRLLELRKCSIKRNNPFEVIGSCSQLEELYYVGNAIGQLDHEKFPQITTFPKLRRYHIMGSHDGHCKVNFSTSKYFNSKNLEKIFSKEIFTSLIGGAEILELYKVDYNRGWTSIVPDIVPMEEKGLKDHLTKLSLESCFEINCVVYTDHLQSSGVIFSKLVELQLHEMGVRELCYGPYPVDFLRQLENLKLVRCQKLKRTLFEGKLELGNLKSVKLEECSMTCLFHPSTAQSLNQLETLEIIECSQLNYIVAEMMDYDDDPNQKSHRAMLQKLKSPQVRRCGELEFILPICFCEDLALLESVKIIRCQKLKYIFGPYSNKRELHQMGKEIVLQLLENNWKFMKYQIS
ncbi:probable disease resistance protein At4g27220 isoform X1 [Prosopis cineraria]|uniref:probable disease resistance protein At4g27220 isoform X1 n=1 Tax=Prosopis cineraria TaxID=364024 RepID=UPI002410AF27|nr:probable disease resistance protein At4g27220 isoform X1 [Prosopis cineraria]